MDLNNIQLTPSTLASLYTNSLVDTGNNNEQKAGPVKDEEKPAALKSLGENKKYVLVVVNYPETVYMPDTELQLLSNMLLACKLSIADVAIVNLANHAGIGYKELIEHFKSRSALLFDIEPASFGLPMKFPWFQLQPFAGCSFLYAPSLTALEADKELKKSLWLSLKRLFNV